MSEGLPDLVSHVKLDTTGVAEGVAKTKAELGGLGGATNELERGFKGLLSSVTSLGPGTSAISGSFSQFGGAAKSALGAASEGGINLKSVMTGVGVGVAGVGVALAGLALEGISKFTAAAGEVRKLQATLGSTAEDASKLRNVAIGLGVDVDTMGKALFKLGPILEKNKGDLGGVNVEIAKNANGNTDLVGTLDNMRKAYQSITDPVQKSQFALDAFKKTGLELRPILSATADQFKSLANTGPIFKQSDLDNAKALSIAQRELKQTVDNLEIALARGLVPAMTTAIDGVSAFVGAFQKVGGVIGPVIDGVQSLRSHLGPLNDVIRLSSGPIGWAAEGLHLLHLGHQNASGSAEKLKAAEADVAAKMQESAKQADAEAKALDKLATAQEANVNAILALEHAQDSLVKAQDNVAKSADAVEKAQDAAETAVRKFGAGSEEAKAAQDSLKSSQDAAHDSTVALKDAYVAVATAATNAKVADDAHNGVIDSAVEKTRIFKAELQKEADQASGPTKDALLALIATIKNIPSDTTSTIHMAGLQDANDGLDGLRAKLRALDGASATVTTYHNNETVYHDDISHSGAAPSGSADSAIGNILGPTGIVPFASGGRTAGFITNGPRFLVGEGNPAYRETVIASDPQFRARNLRLLASAANDLGVGGDSVGAGGSVTTSGASFEFDYERLAAAIAANPPRAYVVASDVQAGVYASGRSLR